MLKLGRVTKVKVLFLALGIVFNFDLFKCSAAILEKGLLIDALCDTRYKKHKFQVDPFPLFLTFLLGI